MVINVDEQLNALASDIDAAVASSLSRTVSLSAASAQDFGNATLADWVDAAKDGVQQAIRGLAAEAGDKADYLRSTVAGFEVTDTDVAGGLQPPGTPGGGPR